jgi:hypothetical protein
MKYYEHILDFYAGLTKDWHLPQGVEIIYPFDSPEVKRLMGIFYRKYFNDTAKRHFLLGINPGRLGAGMTGIPFTDPIRLAQTCKIENVLDKKQELSSLFIYEMIESFGGAKSFYEQFYISSLCPIGFLYESRNYNYYDSHTLLEAVTPHIVDAIEAQLQFPCYRDRAYSIGKGKNYKYFVELNDKYGWFKKIIPLAHPRWVLQYNRKSKLKYIKEYIELLEKS